MIDDQIKVKETLSREVLFQCTMEEEAKAYQFAQEMEAMGIQVEIAIPSVSQTLAAGLGVAEEDWREYQKSMEQEMHDHDCCSPAASD